MGIKSGCLKPTLFGCLGLIVFGLIFGGISAFLALRGLDKQQIEEPELTHQLPGPAGGGEGSSGRVNQVILDLGEGEFKIRPAHPGEGVSVDAHYDREVHELQEDLEVRPDSSWVYRVRFRRTMPALQALFRALMGADAETYVRVNLPPDVPLALTIRSEKGGLEADLGGLWLTEADIRFRMGGFSLSVDEPLREPMDRLSIVGRMGGFEAGDLGNASPRSLDLDWRMGGASVDLDGPWASDADIRMTVRMGGMVVLVPEEVDARGVPDPGYHLRRDAAEVPPPVLRFSLSQRMGEIEVFRR